MSAFLGFDFSSAVITSESNVVTPAGVSVPVLDPQSLARWGTRTAGEQPTPSGIPLELNKWTFPQPSEFTEQLNYVAYSIKEIEGDAALDVIEKIGNLAELLVPGCMGVLFDCRLNTEAVDEDMFRVYGRKLTAGGMPIADAAALLAETNAFAEDNRWSHFSLTEATMREATALFALCAYCVVKAPSQLNQTAFTASRPLASARGAGLSAYPAHLLPTVGDLTIVNNALQQDRRARIPFAHCLVAWATTRSVNSQQAAMASQASLWRDQGFGGLKMTRQLLLGYGAAVQRVARLRAQVPAFKEHWSAYDACQSPVRAYYGAIYGPTNPIAARDDYSLLTLLARDIVQQSFAAGRGMRNFGAGRTVPEDVKTAFVAACVELGLELPAI
jgi:hypothetical protein